MWSMNFYLSKCIKDIVHPVLFGPCVRSQVGNLFQTLMPHTMIFLFSLEKEDGMLFFFLIMKSILLFFFFQSWPLGSSKPHLILRSGNYISLNVSHFCCFFCSWSCLLNSTLSSCIYDFYFEVLQIFSGKNQRVTNNFIPFSNARY